MVLVRPEPQAGAGWSQETVRHRVEIRFECPFSSLVVARPRASVHLPAADALLAGKRRIIRGERRVGRCGTDPSVPRPDREQAACGFFFHRMCRMVSSPSCGCSTAGRTPTSLLQVRATDSFNTCTHQQQQQQQLKHTAGARTPFRNNFCSFCFCRTEQARAEKIRLFPYAAAYQRRARVRPPVSQDRSSVALFLPR